VRYPKPALPFSILPAGLLAHFRDVFEHDRRGAFPVQLLSDYGWTHCRSCGLEHARSSCPACRIAAPISIPAPVRGRVTATVAFRAAGAILHAEARAGRLLVLHADAGLIRREDGAAVDGIGATTGQRYALSRESTLIGDGTRLTVHSPGHPASSLSVDSVAGEPAFAANERHYYWAEGGALWRDGPYGPERIGDVLAGQTRVWVGPQFGFGFYRAGRLTVGFTFDAESRGINDSVAMPRLPGRLVDVDCVFADERCWLFLSAREAGRDVNRCLVLRADGAVLATAEAEAGSPSWLGGIRGRCAGGESLLAATDDGIVRMEARQGSIVIARTFPDAEPFVDAASVLLAGDGGLYVVGSQEVTLLRLT
jgi:hypothetical protein